MLARYMPRLCARLSVFPSVTSRYCIEMTGRIELLSGRRLPSTYPTPCFKKIRVPPKITVLPSESLPPNSGKFRHGKSIALSRKLVVVVVDGRACWRHLYDSRQVVAVYYKSVNCNPVTPFLASICCGFVIQFVSTFDKILTDITRRVLLLMSPYCGGGHNNTAD